MVLEPHAKLSVAFSKKVTSPKVEEILDNSSNDLSNLCPNGEDLVFTLLDLA